MVARWQKALVAWCWAVVAFGAVLMGACFAQTDAPTRALLGLLGDPALDLSRPLRFSVGLMGAVTFGWGLSLLAIATVSHLFDLAVARAVWKRIAVALLAWYAVDSAISIATGFGLNVVSNTALAITFVVIAWRGGVLARGPVKVKN